MEVAEQTRSPEGAEFRDVVGGAAAVEAAEQTRRPEGAEFRGREGGAAASEVAEQTRSPEGAEFRDGEDQPWRVEASIPGARSSMRTLVLLAVRHLNSSSS